MNNANFYLSGNNIMVFWKEYTQGTLHLPDEMKNEKEAQENGVVQIAKVGPDCKVAKEGQWCILNAGGRVLKFNDGVYGIVKEHQIDVFFDEKPTLQQATNTVKQGDIKLDKTLDFLDNYQKNSIIKG